RHEEALLPREYVRHRADVERVDKMLLERVGEHAPAGIDDARAGAGFFRGRKRYRLHDRLRKGFPIEHDAQDADQSTVGEALLADTAGIHERRLPIDQL